MSDGAPQSFDAYETTYAQAVEESIGFIGQDHAFFMAAKVRQLLRLARRIGEPRTLTALDVGCGTGETDALLPDTFAELHGVDVSEALLRTARQRNPHVRYSAYEGRRLPFADESVDLAFAICVMHHVPPADWGAFSAELLRVVRPGGLACVFEHNPYNPLTRRAVSNCAFDDDAILLTRRKTATLLRDAAGTVVDSRYILFLPFGNGRLDGLESGLRRVPLGAQYVVAARPGTAQGR